jgi:hypothetical protein
MGYQSVIYEMNGITVIFDLIGMLAQAWVEVKGQAIGESEDFPIGSWY